MLEYEMAKDEMVEDEVAWYQLYSMLYATAAKVGVAKLNWGVYLLRSSQW